MIQFNLLPDVKIEYIQAQRSRRTMLAIAGLITAVSVSIFGISFGANQLQKNHLSSLNEDIVSKRKQLEGTEGIDKILTIQNQLESLPALHDSKPAVTRVFTFLNQVTPNNTGISGLTLDLVTNTFSITGTSDSLSSVNKYVDTLKFTAYKIDGEHDETENKDLPKAFNSVVLSSFGLASATEGRAAASSFTVSFVYDPAILNIKNKVTLNIESKISSRSEVDKPNKLFIKSSEPTTQGGAN